jgi:superoxide reductase
MAIVHPWSIIWTAAAVALVSAVFVAAGSGRPVWAGQEEQFTPEFKALRSSFDPKHTPKITAPDSVKRVYLHPVYSLPKVTFTIALDEGGSLRAIAEPNHSAGWEVAKKIAVVR